MTKSTNNTKSTALITGGAIRVGKAIAIELAQQNYNIALHYNSSHDAAMETGEEIRKLGVKCELFSCDLNNSAETSQLLNRVVEAMPDLSVLINSASIFEKCGFIDTNIDILDRHMNINFKAPFILSQSFATHCNKGLIVNILDTYITSNNQSYCAYLLSKKSLYELTKMTAKTLAPHIRVNGICIGSLLASEHWTQDDVERHNQQLPLQRTPTIDDITNTLKYIIDSPFLTGQCIFVDSGQHIAV